MPPLDEFEIKKTSWVKKIAELNQQLKQKSNLCEFVKKDSAEGM